MANVDMSQGYGAYATTSRDGPLLRAFAQRPPRRVPSQARPIPSAMQIVVQNLRTAVAASYQELSAQVQAASALDAKLPGLLGFFAVADSLLLDLPPGLHHGRALLLAGASLGTLVCVVATLRRATPNVGPPAGEFYRDYGAAAHFARHWTVVAVFTGAGSRGALHAA